MLLVWHLLAALLGDGQRDIQAEGTVWEDAMSVSLQGRASGTWCLLRDRTHPVCCAVAMQQHGYEVFIAHAPESDPVKCHERNIHKRSLQDIQKAAAAWEPLAPLYAQLEVKALIKPESAGGPQPGSDLPMVVLLLGHGYSCSCGCVDFL